MRYLSFFSGIEAASCAWQSLGWKLVGLSEIEKFPCNVLTKHYPKVPNLGDITKITGDDLSKLGHIDLIVGGSPCQGFSVAGKQEGLKDERSGLAKEYIRVLSIVKPKWLVWENVPGVFSTNGGDDFRSFVKEITDIGYGICWRVLDAQYFGVAQRRRRVFLIGYFGDWRPAYKVLFESQSLPRYLETLERTGQRITSSAKGSSRKTGTGTTCLGTAACMGYGKYVETEKAETLRASGGDLGGGSENICYDMAHPVDVIRTYEDGKTPTLEARMGTGGNNIPLVQDRTLYLERQYFTTHEGKASTLTRDIYRDPPAVVENKTIGLNGTGKMCYEIKENGEGLTLTARQYKDPPIVLNDQGGSRMTVTEDKTATLRAQANGHHPIVVQGSAIGRKVENGPQGSGINIDKYFTLNTTDRHAVCTEARVRKLTPVECLRLQGFPDDWFEGVEGYSDTAAYKAIGNSMAVPCMRWIGESIAEVDKEL